MTSNVRFVVAAIADYRIQFVLSKNMLSMSRVSESQVHSKSRFLIGQCIIILNDVMIDQSERAVLLFSKTFFWTMNQDGGKSKNLNDFFKIVELGKKFWK